MVEEEIQQVQALEAARAGGRGCGVAGSVPGPGPVVPPTDTPTGAPRPQGHPESWGSWEGPGACWDSPGKALQVRDREAPGLAVPPISSLLPAAEIPKSSGFPPRAAQPGGSLLEVTVLKGWLIILGGKWRGGDSAPRRELGPREGTQSLTATPGTALDPGLRESHWPLDHLPNCPISQLTSQLPDQLTH